MAKNKKLLWQLIVRAGIFLIFFLGIFVKPHSLLLYLLFLLIIANIVLGFINGKRSILLNISFLILYPLLYVVIIEYFATLLGSVISFIGLILFYFWYKKGASQSKKK